MQRHIIAGLLLAALMGTSACTDRADKADSGLMQVSSIRWDEIAAASSTAHVNNNGLIMMR